MRGFDAALVAGKVNPAYVDDGMRYAVYKWATEEEAQMGADTGYVDRRLAEAAALLSFCVLGPADTEAEFGPARRAENQQRFARALAEDADASFDARVIKLALARGIAAAGHHRAGGTRDVIIGAAWVWPLCVRAIGLYRQTPARCIPRSSDRLCRVLACP